jgi:glycosyltransferase involved in cell wall biosynthesis
MNITLVRGKHLNLFEMQNYLPLKNKHHLTLIGSKTAIHKKFPVKTKLLWSPTDLPDFPHKMPILNRALVDAHYLFGLEKLLTGQDIVHVAETYYHYTQQAIRAKKKDLIKKIISTVWETIPHNNEGIWGRKIFKNEAKKHVDLFICHTNRAKTALEKEGFDPSKITVIPLGVDNKRFCPKKGKKRKTKNILSICRLEPEKGVLELLVAFKDLNMLLPKTKLILIGQGSLKKKILEFIEKNNLIEQVKLKTVPYSKIHLEYQQADIFVLNSQTTLHWEEQYGMSLVEAMSCGLPVISTKTGAIPEVLSKSNILISPKQPPALTKALFHLCQNANLTQKIGQENRKLAQKSYNHLKSAQKINQLYEKLLKT